MANNWKKIQLGLIIHLSESSNVSVFFRIMEDGIISPDKVLWVKDLSK